MTNGCEAQRRKQKLNGKNAGKGGTSQLKANEKAMDIQCKICRQPFLSTVRAPALTQHAVNKHDNMKLSDCFPNYVEQGKK
ncbi:hypothetical protein ASPZODRAFT_133788 [Penicilliopsis zonata CBS 506.65]|uniref:At2g23090-like zinc-binding domain-containing protein n=1 Tax=Penicilliopsis zonata CBS 506.65 TaxID=1073090 RepID=A0A1L9SFC7_9EURO|nr:hypothetical protein ASPZODRAFT_133788 [Penicilliopsis zonata CBS 506.65]OJJ45920.1 hypothetical protein ASPZODRAFT_133788 [Penicilliopsis zonata CBS 506.65]